MENTSELVPSFKPLMVTLSDPFRSIMGFPATVPEMVLAPLGLINREVHAPAFRLFVPDSVVTFAVMVITILAPVCAVPFSAGNAPAAFVSDV